MKKLLIILGVLLSINAFGQFGKSVQLMGEGTINGAESVLLKSKRMAQANGFIGMQIVVDTLAINSGTGYAVAKASLYDFDNAWEWSTMNEVENVVYVSRNDTLTVTVPDSYLWGLSVISFDYVGFYIVGAVGDTFTYRAYWVGKEY